VLISIVSAIDDTNAFSGTCPTMCICNRLNGVNVGDATLPSSPTQPCKSRFFSIEQTFFAVVDNILLLLLFL
jgi:hypothetical protein